MTRLVGTFFGSQTAVAKRQPLAEFRQHAPCVIGGVRLRDSVMQMNLDLSPARMAMLRDHFQQSLVVLLRGIEIRMNKGTAIMVAPAIDRFRIFAAPPLDPPLLFWARNPLLTIGRVDGWFKVIRHRDDQMHGPRWA